MDERIICESCAMPLKREEDFGTESDGSKVREYCKFCYIKGKFVDEGITLSEKIEKLVEIGVNTLGMTKEQAQTMAESQLPNLKRWKN
ncbi:transcriptional regulator [Candidatus Pacearchaeota archaeon]|nr:transcriptional regulator [Candidatus Pacearchaeota archaeon]